MYSLLYITVVMASLHTQDCASDGSEGIDRREFWGSVVLLSGLAGAMIASRRGRTKQVVETVLDHRALLQQEISGSLESLGYQAMIFDREAGGYNVHVQPNNLPDVSEAVEVDDACFFRMAGCILRSVKEKRDEEQNTTLTVFFDLPVSSMTNRSVGIIERLKAGGVELGGLVVGSRELDEFDKLPELPNLEHITVPGMSENSMHVIFQKAPHLSAISTGSDENVELSRDTVEMLRALGRKSVMVNGEDIKI